MMKDKLAPTKLFKELTEQLLRSGGYDETNMDHVMVVAPVAQMIMLFAVGKEKTPQEAVNETLAAMLAANIAYLPGHLPDGTEKLREIYVDKLKGSGMHKTHPDLEGLDLSFLDDLDLGHES